MASRWRNASGQRVRVAGARERCADCPCDATDICDGTFDGSLWQARLTVDFTTCDPVPIGADVACDAINVTDVVAGWVSGDNRWNYGSGTDEARCLGGNPYFGYWYKLQYKVNVVCPSGGGGNGKVQLYVRAKGVVEFDSLIAEITGLSTIETGTVYSLTPKTDCGGFPNGDCLCDWDANPAVEFESV